MRSRTSYYFAAGRHISLVFRLGPVVVRGHPGLIPGCQKWILYGNVACISETASSSAMSLRIAFLLIVTDTS